MSSTKTPAEASIRTRELWQHFEILPEFREAVSALSQAGQATFDGVKGSSCALLAAALLERAPTAVVLVSARPSDADALRDGVELFSARPQLRYPAWEAELGERFVHDETYGDRLRTLKQLATNPKGKRMVVTSIQSLLQPAPSREQIESNSRLLRCGDRIDLAAFQRWLAEQRFHATSAVELPGEFSVRGGILDVFAPDWDGPVRIELFDDEIESIRRFEVATQRSRESLDEVEVTVLNPTMAADGHFADYLPEDSWILLFEPEAIVDAGKQYLTRLEHPEAFHSVTAVMARFQSFGTATAASLARGAMGAYCQLGCESVERFSGEVARVKDELERTGADHNVILVTSTEGEIERLREVFSATELNSSGRLHFVVGHLPEGFRLTRDRVVVISANELFHRAEVRRISRRRLGKAIDSFMDLRTNDLVIHLAHGIGRYRGIELIDKQGQVEEHLQIEFHGGAKVYVPAARIDLVQKYVGGTKSRPRLAKLGGATWHKQKKAAEHAVMDMAVEMLEVQAARVSRVGIAFAPDGEWQREFDASFPYQETNDQLAALQDIKVDMETARPMDRLLCGDVGFGKTEVAMRAAFKAVDNGYQVAILVPTTVLAEQHYHTFMARMAEFPFDIARLSRFCRGKEQREIVKGLASGKIDIVIGTHRLASKDIKFYNLGLVVIDEEQRFGVEVKERLKTFRNEVDVLTMSATPIPRTLHMSLVGARDISNLETPPEDRVAIETRLTRFDNDLIRHAVLRELNRGGQIFFVHNRVQNIEILARKIKEIVPEASLAIAHGQMHEEQLERVMVDFVAHRFDLLVATTIVESGLDIPNANTIFIDEANRYGLADLHQLRGRVGRYKHRAYCYLLIDRHKHVTPSAAKRLHAIQEYSEIGAGFALAMRDLEIRGAGNLLGTQQSGHIAAVGYEFYCQLLENAVRTIKKLPGNLSMEVDIDLPGTAYIPDEYVPDLRLKIDLYRRLRRISAFDDLDEFRAELTDRYGKQPAEVERMLELVELRMNAAIWQIQAISTEDEFLVFRYSDRGRIEQLARALGRKMRIVDAAAAYLKVPTGPKNPNDFFRVAKSVLRPN
jgi:transcription-repair coupling factor (superfamily II helicase)